MSKEFTRKTKENMPVLAICYDFDKTLSPDDMQAQGFIQSLNQDVQSFWEDVNELAEDNEMDNNLAYMFRMKEQSNGKVLFTKAKLEEYGSKVKLFPGVEDWFDRIKKYGKNHGVIVEHYIISSGLKEMIEGTKVAKNGAFEKIYASSFYYDEFGVAVWPSQVVNYTNKTQFLFRIEKGVLDVNDPAVNDYCKEEDLRVPFRNMVYIGDSDTDVPCMKLVNNYGGHSIGVFNEDVEDNKNSKTKVYKMLHENRIKYFAPANYTDGSKLDILIKSIIDRTSVNEKLVDISQSCKDEIKNEYDEQIVLRQELINSLKYSNSFARTTSLVKEMMPINWTDSEKETLFEIAIKNSQVKYILGNNFVKDFFNKLLESCGTLSENANLVKEGIDTYYKGKKKS